MLNTAISDGGAGNEALDGDGSDESSLSCKSKKVEAKLSLRCQSEKPEVKSKRRTLGVQPPVQIGETRSGRQYESSRRASGANPDYQKKFVEIRDSI